MRWPTDRFKEGDRVRFLGTSREYLSHGAIGIVLNVNRYDIFVRFDEYGVGAFDEDALELVERT